MRGYLRKRGQRSWSIAVYIGKGPNGKSRYRYVSVKGTRRQAEHRMAQVVAQLEDYALAEPTTGTVADFLNRWYREHALPNVRAKPNTVVRLLTSSPLFYPP